MDPADVKKCYVLAVGDFSDGFVFHGPFEEHQSAVDYAEECFRDDQWIIFDVYAPTTGEE